MRLIVTKNTIGIEVNFMKVLGINSSARRDGNTAILIRTVFDELNKQGIETELIQLAEEAITPCKACFACAGKKNCVHKTDIFNNILEKMIVADGIVLGSPVYSANVSANMQALLERAAVVGDVNPQLFRHKVGVAVVSARRGGAIGAIDTINHFFLNHEMFVAGSTYWNMAYGKLPGDVLSDKEGINNVRNLGQNMAFLMKSLKK